MTCNILNRKNPFLVDQTQKLDVFGMRDEEHTQNCRKVSSKCSHDYTEIHKRTLSSNRTPGNDLKNALENGIYQIQSLEKEH